jgi:hypothetical protein
LPSVRVGLRRVLGRELGCYLATMELADGTGEGARGFPLVGPHGAHRRDRSDVDQACLQPGSGGHRKKA